MNRRVVAVALWLAAAVACGRAHRADRRDAAPTIEPTATLDGGADASAAPVDAATATAPTPPPGVDLMADVAALRALALCDGSAPIPALPAGVHARHCARIAASQHRYVEQWLKPARGFFADVVPAGLPSTVVYPFAGGDLATVLTVFPDATEITTLSLEPAGDPRAIAVLSPAQRARAVDVIADELHFLYVVNFSNTLNLINAMRGGELPTQLSFSLSALALHGLELVWVRYFKLDADGAVVYLTADDVAAAPPPTSGDRDRRNRVFGDVELGFRRPGETAVRIYRHLQVNLDDAHQSADPRVLRHLAAKGQVAAMTKAAAYLLGWDNFSLIRGWLIEHATWMVSDGSGLPPQLAGPAGFTQEVWGQFVGAHMRAGARSDRAWRALFAAQPPRPLPIPFGYRDRAGHPHLIVTRRP